ncbi:hypothetical protein DPSP01_000974 [Paraphaeosphaeria sporulosa]
MSSAEPRSKLPTPGKTILNIVTKHQGAAPPTTTMPTLKANPSPTTPILLRHRWRCCHPSCTHLNTSTTPVHFAPYFSPTENAPIRAPGYYGQKCASCAHPACEVCCFLEVSRVDGKSAASAAGERSPWVEIGCWGRREDFPAGEVVGLRSTDELPPASKRGLSEAWRKNGRRDA